MAASGAFTIRAGSLLNTQVSQFMDLMRKKRAGSLVEQENPVLFRQLKVLLSKLNKQTVELGERRFTIPLFLKPLRIQADIRFRYLACEMHEKTLN